MIVVRALAAASEPPPALPAAEPPLGWHPGDGALAAVVTTGAPPAVTADTVLAHAELVLALARSMPVVPVRFGAAVGDERALTRQLHEREEALLATLARVGGQLEVLVRPREPVPEPPPTPRPTTAGEGAGRAYLEERLAAQRAHADALRATEQRLAAATDPLRDQASEVLDLVGRRGPERCFLVPVDRADGFVRRAAATVGDDHVVAGPWPPFTFADPELTSAAEVPV